MDIRKFIETMPLLFDGAMGTYFSSLTDVSGMSCEAAALSRPDVILTIHRKYLDAGANAIKTDTFGANRISLQGDGELTERIIEKASALAQQAAGEREAAVFGDIGPIPELGSADLSEEYRFVIDAFLRNGIRNFLFETHSSDTGLKDAASYIKEQVPDAFLIASFAVSPDGYTREGLRGAQLCREMAETGLFDAVGFNCVSGVYHMLHLMAKIRDLPVPISLMPNAGYPTVIGNRTYYKSDPEYFGQQVARMFSGGAKIVGGCCGTDPDYIAAVKKAILAGNNEYDFHITPNEEVKSHPETNHFWEKLASGKKVIAVELDPPKADQAKKFLSGARRLTEAGADLITIADCPIARPRMDSSLLACKVHHEMGVDVLPHMTCRDRNLNATKALLLALSMEGVHNVLAVTGDPIPTAERDEVKSVYQFNSRKLARFISGLNEEELTTPFRIFGALNVNAYNFNSQLGLAKKKVENGMSGFLTQPVLTEQAFENLKTARKELPSGIKILGGIIPVVSARNARFMDSEISGINVDPRIAEMMDGKSREECSDMAVKISCEIANKIAPCIDGYYLMTPFGRVSLITEIMEKLPN